MILGLLGLSPAKMIGIGVALALAAGVVFYVKHNESVKEQLLAENAQLQADISTYKSAVQTQNDTIAFLQEQQRKRAEDFLRIESRFSQIRNENQQLKDKLIDFERSMNAAANPQAAEIVVNDISDNLNRCFELMSGAPLTDIEKKAKNENEFNPECPWLYSDLLGR